MLDYEAAQITEAERSSTLAADIHRCLHAGVLPKCYEGSNISVAVQYQSQVSCFIRHADGTVTCPMGRQLFKHGDKKYGTVYGSQEACRTCPNRCTDSKNAKTVNIGYNTNYVPVIMYGDSRYELQRIPDVEQNTPYNHFGKRKRKDARVMLTIKRDLSKQQLRKETVEHPFGTIKWYHGAHYFLCRGKEKVTAEIALSFTGYNMRRAINMIGVPGIVMHLRAKMTEKAS